jgi:hypothetical protein
MNAIEHHTYKISIKIIYTISLHKNIDIVYNLPFKATLIFITSIPLYLPPAK